jgi:hypothetical protein
LESAADYLHNKEIAPFFDKLKKADFIAWEKVFISNTDVSYEKSLFEELILPLTEEWEEVHAEAQGALGVNVLKTNLDFEQQLTGYLDASAELAKVPRDLHWESLEKSQFKPNVGRWLRLWLRLWTIVHHPNWGFRNQHTRNNRLQVNPKLD